jgi:hypothetical protein
MEQKNKHLKLSKTRDEKRKNIPIQPLYAYESSTKNMVNKPLNPKQGKE